MRRCADPRESSIEARRAALEYNCICAEEQRYVYDWDELNRLAEARRYERHGTAGWPLAMQQRYFYDAGNVRMIKETVDFGRVGEGAAFNATTLSPYPGDYERRGVTLDFAGSTYHASPTLGTETQYLVGGARLVWASNTPGSGNLTRRQRLTLPLSDLVQSTAAVVDLQSGELLEHTTFYPNGARETHRTNDDVSMQLEPVGFTGKEADEEVGLVYFGERYLIPRLGRWASVDPLSVHAVGGGEALNSYHYIGGNLLQARDPLGLTCDSAVQSCPANDPDQVSGARSVDDGSETGSVDDGDTNLTPPAPRREICGPRCREMFTPVPPPPGPDEELEAFFDQVALEHPLLGPLVAEAALCAVPGACEAMDIAVAVDPDEHPIVRGVAAVSAVAPFLPPIGGVASRLLRRADDVPNLGNIADDLTLPEEVPTTDLYFSQPTASPNFSSGGHTISSTTDDLLAGRITPNDLPPLQVVEYDGRLVSIDNRRLVAYSLAGVERVPIVRQSLSEPDVARRFWERYNPIDGLGQNIVITPRAGREAAESVLREQGRID